jgi:hypothetical protein
MHCRAIVAGFAERLTPRLRRAVNQHELSLKPRELVEMALANLHPTVLGKTAIRACFIAYPSTRHIGDRIKSTLLCRLPSLFHVVHSA